MPNTSPHSPLPPPPLTLQIKDGEMEMFWPFDFRGKGHLLFRFVLSKTLVPIFSLIYKTS